MKLADGVLFVVQSEFRDSLIHKRAELLAFNHCVVLLLCLQAGRDHSNLFAFQSHLRLTLVFAGFSILILFILVKLGHFNLSAQTLSPFDVAFLQEALT